jgi:biopolymer transport protein ExbD
MKKITIKSALKAVVAVASLALLMTANVNHAKAAEGELKAITIKTRNQDVSSGSITGKMSAQPDNEYVRADVVKVKIDCAGLIRFYIKGNNSDQLSLTLYSDESLKNDVAYTTLNTEDEKTAPVTVPKAGTYYLDIRGFETEDVDYTISADITSSEDDTITSGKGKYVTLVDDKDVNYYQFSLKQDGAVKVYTTYGNGTKCDAQVEVCQKAGGSYKTVAKLDSTVEGSVVGLAKGTYYIKLKGEASYYSLKYDLTVSSDKSGSSKQKAAALKLGTAAKGVITVQDKASKADWYKIKLTKNQSVTLSLSGDVTGIVSLEFYDSSDIFWGGLIISEYTKDDSTVPYLVSVDAKGKKLPKGTYYMKVTKDKNATSGSYSVKIK